MVRLILNMIVSIAIIIAGIAYLIYDVYLIIKYKKTISKKQVLYCTRRHLFLLLNLIK